ncbi:MAG: hypothetical protein AAF404_08990 [Pseudomonadota bacterium]
MTGKMEQSEFWTPYTRHCFNRQGAVIATETLSGNSAPGLPLGGEPDDDDGNPVPDPVSPPIDTVYRIENLLDFSDPRHLKNYGNTNYLAHMEDKRMTYLRDAGLTYNRHHVKKGTKIGGNTRWLLSGVNGRELYLSWRMRIIGRKTSLNSTKLPGPSAPQTVGFNDYTRTYPKTVDEWNQVYKKRYGGNGSGGAGLWLGWGSGPNGKGKGWSARCIHSKTEGTWKGRPIKNKGILSTEMYHTKSDNIVNQNGCVRQFGENLPWTLHKDDTHARIEDHEWHLIKMYVRLNSKAEGKIFKADGQIKAWVDGHHVFDSGPLHMAEDDLFRRFAFYDIVFHGGSDDSEQDFTVDIDDVRYSAEDFAAVA